MTDSAAASVVNAYCHAHNTMLHFMQKLSDEQLCWRYETSSNSIAWNGWHVARWADHFQAAVPGMTPELRQRLGQRPQIWYTENVAGAWGFPASDLGFDQTGMHMPDAVARALPFPTHATLLDYIGRAFAAAESAVQAIDTEQYNRLEQRQDMTDGIFGESTVGDALLEHVTHAYRHLGMMECLLGLQVERGTATE